MRCRCRRWSGTTLKSPASTTGRPESIKRTRVRDQPLEPRELVVELRSGLRIAVRQVDSRRRRGPSTSRFEVARLRSSSSPGKPRRSSHRLLASREDGDAVMRALAVPDRAVACVLDRVRRKLVVAGLDLLQADDVGARLVEPLEQPRQPAVDAVDVVGRDFQATGHEVN